MRSLECLTAVSQRGTRNLGLAEIVAFVVPANVRSQRVMARLGMQRDPAGDFDHPAIPDNSPVKRHWLFRLPAEAHRRRAR
ncbi:MAG TPA: GNAT family N-acetyltransferase [Kofleriaceae bacterium]|nr:GNAT family N-acetyltransferase [Kofleriaceae bacterium]